jgi:hypothetical protein
VVRDLDANVELNKVFEGDPLSPLLSGPDTERVNGLVGLRDDFGATDTERLDFPWGTKKILEGVRRELGHLGFEPSMLSTLCSLVVDNALFRPEFVALGGCRVGM